MFRKGLIPAELTSLLEADASSLSSCSRSLLDISAPGGGGESRRGGCTVREKLIT